MILNRTNCKTISKVCGSPYIEQWAGHRIQIYATTTRMAGETVECLRIRDKAPEDVQIPCEECGQLITPAFSMSATQLAVYTGNKYGKKLCAECAKAMNGKKEENQDGAE